MTTEDKLIDVETIDYVFNNMEYDWSEIEEELKEAIGLTLKFKNQKIIEEIKKLTMNSVGTKNYYKNINIKELLKLINSQQVSGRLASVEATKQSGLACNSADKV